MPSGFNKLRFDTVEVRSSSLLVPTISFNHLASLTSSREAPNGSIKRARTGEGMMFHTPRSRRLLDDRRNPLPRLGRFTSISKAVADVRDADVLASIWEERTGSPLADDEVAMAEALASDCSAAYSVDYVADDFEPGMVS